MQAGLASIPEPGPPLLPTHTIQTINSKFESSPSGLPQGAAMVCDYLSVITIEITDGTALMAVAVLRT